MAGVVTGAELRLSKSSMAEWLRCHYAYFLHAVLRRQPEPTPEILIGRNVHAGIEAYWKGEPPPDLDDDARKLVGTYIAKIAPTFTPTHVEAKFAIRVDGVIVSGALDAADEESVHDTKTTSTPSKVDPERYRTEMTIYQAGARALGLNPTRLILDVIGRNGRTKSVPVEPDEAGMAELIGYVAKEIRTGNFEPNGARTGACHGCGFARTCRHSTVDRGEIMQPTGDPVQIGEGDA